MFKSLEIGNLIEEDVVPHLVRSLVRHDGDGARGQRHNFADDLVRRFSEALLEPNDEPAMSVIGDLRKSGVDVEAMYLGLFADSARLLGDQWAADSLPFTEVTLGLWRLHRLVREISRDTPPEIVRGKRFLQALLTTAPGEQHSFGLALVSEWFRRAGWCVAPGPLQTSAEIARAVSLDFLTVVGFSASSDRNVDRLAVAIEQVRRKSRNRSVGVMVGGALFNKHPELVAQVGADATAADAAEALAKAQRFAVCGEWVTT